MRKDLALPRWVRYAAGGVLMAVAVTAGGLSLTLNVMHGMEAGLAAGIAFGLADIGKILLPVVAGIIGWSRQMRATAAICVAVSLWSAVNVYLDGAGRDLLVKQHGALVYAEAGKQITELEREAASLRSLAAAEAGKGGCRQNCRALTEQASRAAAELRKARAARAELRPVEISGLAAMVAMASGENPEGVARGIAAIKALLFLALIEVLVWLSVPAMVLLLQSRRAADDIERITTPPSPVAKPFLGDAKPASGTRAYYLARLHRDYPALARLVNKGELSVYAASIKAGIRKAAAKNWLKPEAYGQKMHQMA